MLSVSSLKGGVGKTSVTLGLASAAYSRGIPTLVIDMDPQADASTGLDIPVRTDVDIADVLAAPRRRVLERAVVPSGWVGDQLGHIDVISGSPRAAEFDQPTLSIRYLRKLSEAIHKAGTGYRLVLIDCPPSLNGLTRAAWTASNRVLIVTEPGLFSVAAADRALRATDELRRRTSTDLQPLGIVVNRARLQSREHSYRIEELREMFGPLVINPPIPERTVLQQAQGSARPIHSWPGKPAAELAAGFDKILDRALRSEKIRRKARPTGTDGASSGDASDGASVPVTSATPGTPATDKAPRIGTSKESVVATQSQPESTSNQVSGPQDTRSTQVSRQSAKPQTSGPQSHMPQSPQSPGSPAAAQPSSFPQSDPTSLRLSSNRQRTSSGDQDLTLGGPATRSDAHTRRPPKPQTAPAVGAAASARSPRQSERPEARDASAPPATDTAAVPLVEMPDGADLHEPDTGEDAFLTRRQLREQREQDKHGKKKWFGR